ncbi:helix-turn-helix transcriptional regulator [Bosea sp. NBC_00550]|uniref:helix-turn-helix transcriptional regulator n=1 Tax=Bosea sp. NBC_00550 TaxID=2969621 RepID=UPI0022314ECF|nr:helix-turn-helix domain-containing protein [Bosea sp. NBC_00550]UZF92685.1 helix-turn-helix domain-containing protein [Bosea sp. NBC_00550]
MNGRLPTTPPEQLLTSRETAERLGLAENTVARMRCHGTGPEFLKLGRAVRYRWRDVEQWLAGRMQTST